MGQDREFLLPVLNHPFLHSCETSDKLTFPHLFFSLIAELLLKDCNKKKEINSLTWAVTFNQAAMINVLYSKAPKM